MLLIGIHPVSTDFPPIFMSVDGVDPVADHGGGLYVGKTDVEMLLPDADLMEDDEGYLSIIRTDLGDAQGILDDDGHLVWSVMDLPGFVSVTIVDVDKMIDGQNAGEIRETDIDGDDITARLNDNGDVVVQVEADGGDSFMGVILPQPVWRAFAASVARLID